MQQHVPSRAAAPILRAPSRAVTPEEVTYIRHLVAAHPTWGRQALALHLCQVWEWRRPDGTWNHRACRHLLGRLATRGLLTLPPRQSSPGRRRPAPPGPVPPPGAAPRAGDALTVRPVRPAERPHWRALLAQHHYLGWAHPVGEALSYVATLADRWVALLAWAAAAFKCGPRDAWIGWDEALKARRLHLVANNVRFLILPGVHRPNLASQVLARNLRRLSADWQARYGHPVLLVETFVDGARFRGTCYRAAGWRALGTTRGFGRTRGGYVAHGRPKLVFVRPLHPDAPRLLAAPLPPPLWPARKETRPMLDVHRLPLEGAGGLVDLLRTVTDPRRPRGVRHAIVTIVALAVCACLAGARSFEAIAQWAAGLSPEALWRLGGRRKTPPSEPTFRRVLQRLDVATLDRAVGAWLVRQTVVAGQGVAVDGKTLRGARDGDQPAPHLLSAVLHQEGLVLAQAAVGDKTNEIPCLPPLLEAVPLAGAVVTADALHTQDKTAQYLVEDRKADYGFTVKDNQPTLKDDIQALRLDAFPPSVHGNDEGPRPDRDPAHLGER
jgi:hypothetical protein